MKLSVFALTAALGALLVVPLAAQTQPTFTTLYDFKGPPADGNTPFGALVRAKDGTLFGTTAFGTSTATGGVFALTPPMAPGQSWTETVLARFSTLGASDPAYSGVVIGPHNVLYGTTQDGGSDGRGAVYQLTPPAERGGTWTGTILYSFTGGLSSSEDGDNPEFGVVVGPQGMLYGTTNAGGDYKYGIVFGLTPPASAGSPWTETVLYSFHGDGGVAGWPNSGVVVARNGSLYGVTFSKGKAPYLGTVFELKPPPAPGGTWTERTIHTFEGGPADGASPSGNLAVAADGTLYGVTSGGGSAGSGTVYSLKPPTAAGTWTESILHNFVDSDDGGFPLGGLVLGPAGRLFGSTTVDAGGTVFELAPPMTAGGAWTLSTLYTFPFGSQADIQGALCPGAPGSLFGVTPLGGIISVECGLGCGTVFRVTY